MSSAIADKVASVSSPVNVAERKSLDMKVGDTVRVHQKIEEKGKTRTQIYEGLVLSRNHGSEPGATFTVRRTGANNIGMEKIFPLYSPNIQKIEIKSRSKTRRAKLFYIRDKAAKEISKKMRQLRFAGGVVADETIQPDSKDEEMNEEPETEAGVVTDTTEATAEAVGTPAETQNKEETEDNEAKVTPEAEASTTEDKKED